MVALPFHCSWLFGLSLRNDDDDDELCGGGGKLNCSKRTSLTLKRRRFTVGRKPIDRRWISRPISFRVFVSLQINIKLSRTQKLKFTPMETKTYHYSLVGLNLLLRLVPALKIQLLVVVKYQVSLLCLVLDSLRLITYSITCYLLRDILNNYLYLSFLLLTFKIGHKYSLLLLYYLFHICLDF